MAIFSHLIQRQPACPNFRSAMIRISHDFLNAFRIQTSDMSWIEACNDSRDTVVILNDLHPVLEEFRNCKNSAETSVKSIRIRVPWIQTCSKNSCLMKLTRKLPSRSTRVQELRTILVPQGFHQEISSSESRYATLAECPPFPGRSPK